MSLTSANARLSVFGLATAGVAGGDRRRHRVGARLRLGAAARPPWSSSSPAVLVAPAARSTSTCPTGEMPADVLTTAEIPVGPGRRRRPVSPHVVLALRANAALRGLGGFLTIFSAFLVQADVPRRLGGDPGAGRRSPPRPGMGSFAGTAAGSRLHAADPDRLVLIAAAAAAGDHRRSPRSSSASRWPRWSRSSPRSPTRWARCRWTRSSSARCPRACGPRRSPGRRPCSSWPGWSAAPSASRCRPPAGSGFTVAAALLVLAVGLVALEPAPRAAARRDRRRRTSPRTHRPTPAGAAVVVSSARRRPAARSLAGRLRRERGGRRPADVEVVGRRAGASPCGPTQYCLDGDGQRYTNTPPILEVSPDTADRADRPRRGRRARAGACRCSTRSWRRRSARSTCPRARRPSTRSTPPTSSRRRSTWSSSRTRAATAASSPAPGRSASSAPAAT